MLLGEAGLGKTLTTYQWGDQLLEQWWAHINTGTPAPAYFPLFIRPELPTWSHAGIKGAFQEVARKYNLPKGIQPLVFINGYDELQLDEEPTNLVEHLGLSGAGHTKLIITCRYKTVEKSALESRFGFNGALTTRYFLPFSLDQLLSYLQQERSEEEAVYQEYQKTLENTEPVRTVLRNPFVLHLFRESWETLSKRPLHQLNRWQIYEGFIEHSIQSGKALLSKKVRKRLKDNYPNLLTSYQAFMSEIAWCSFQQKGTTLGWQEAKRISPWRRVQQYAKKAAKDEFVERQAQQQKALSKVAEAEQAQLGRRNLLRETDYVSLTQQRVDQFEAELPLKLRGEGNQKHYEYSHKSLFEYGMAKGLLLLKNSSKRDRIEKGITLLNNRKIQEEPGALQFWQEGWKESGSEVLIDPLFVLITRSRDNEAIQQASANAATLIAQAQVAFSGHSLQGVRLPGADLSGAILSHTSLAGAQLQGALLRGAYVGNADLREANLSNVDFGQYPSLECKNIVLCLNYNPMGTQLALGLYDGNIELYNKKEEAYTSLATLQGHTGRVWSVAYRPDGQQLASGSEDQTIGLWNLNRLQLVAWLRGHTYGVRSVAYRPDGQQLASGSEDKTVGLWDTHRQQLITRLQGHTDRVESVSWSPDGHQIASGSGDRRVGLWDIRRQQLVTQLEGHTSSVRSVTYRPDGQQLASGSEDHTVGLWDTSSQQLIKRLQGHAGTVYSVAYHPDGKQLTSGSDDRMVGLWDSNSLQLITLLEGHTGGVTSVSYHPDGEQLASGSNDSTVGLWDPNNLHHITLLQGHTGPVTSVFYRPDDKQLASGSWDNAVGLWDPHRRQLVTLLKEHTGLVWSVSYRPDGQQLASGSEDETIGIWDPHSQQRITKLQGHNSSVNSVTYRPDGQQLASGSNDKTIRIWDSNSLEFITQLKGHIWGVTSVAYRLDGNQLASGSKDKTIGLWDPGRLWHLNQLKGHTKSVTSVAYRPDGRELASGSEDNTVGIWDPHLRHLRLITQLKGHTGGVVSVSYSPDGKQLASGSKDRTIRFWDPSGHQCITLLQGHTGTVTSVAYRSDGNQLASGSDDQAIFVWAKQDTSGSLQENWQLIRRFENTSSLWAPGALLKGVSISPSNRALLKQKGAQDDEDAPDYPSLT